MSRLSLQESHNAEFGTLGSPRRLDELDVLDASATAVLTLCANSLGVSDELYGETKEPTILNEATSDCIPNDVGE